MSWPDAFEIRPSLASVVDDLGDLCGDLSSGQPPGAELLRELDACIRRLRCCCAPPALQSPLTDGRIFEEIRLAGLRRTDTALRIARAVERAHGIGVREDGDAA